MRTFKVKPFSFKKTLPWIKKIQFTLLVLAATAFVIVRVYECLTTFFDGETGTQTLYLPTSETSFPDLTICPSDPYNQDKLIQNGIKSVHEYRWNSNWNSNHSGKTAKELYEEVVIDVATIAEKIDIYLRRQYNGSSVISFSSFYKKVCGYHIFEIKEYYYNGDCLSLIIPDCLSQSGVLEIGLEFNMNVHIFLHHKGKAKLEITDETNFLF